MFRFLLNYWPLNRAYQEGYINAMADISVLDPLIKAVIIKHYELDEAIDRALEDND